MFTLSKSTDKLETFLDKTKNVLSCCLFKRKHKVRNTPQDSHQSAKPKNSFCSAIESLKSSTFLPDILYNIPYKLTFLNNFNSVIQKTKFISKIKTQIWLLTTMA